MSNSDHDTPVLAPFRRFAQTFLSLQESDLPIAFCVCSHVGLTRSRNEDHFAMVGLWRDSELLPGSLTSQDLSVPMAHSHAMIVAGGMGGIMAGELASRLA
jgi:serine/threonine protein phosphatase PrpC